MTSDEKERIDTAKHEFLRNNEILKQQKDALAPKVGDIAPDFQTEQLSADGKRTSEFTMLSELLDKPVGLIFGSYTCPYFRNNLPRFEQVYQSLKHSINFLCIYIREAHPIDGNWPLPNGINKGICISAHKNLDQRANAAKYLINNALTVPLVLDTMADDLLDLYAGSPERLYIIGIDGIVIHKSPIGPLDKKQVDEWHNALRVL